MNKENYINTLYENQNIGLEKEQQNLTSRDYYESLVFDVTQIIKEHPDYSIDELRKILIQNSHLEDLIKDFYGVKKSAPGMVMTLNTKYYEHNFVFGNREEVITSNEKIIPHKEIMTYDTIFDLASTTKLFTGITTLKLVEMGLINLSSPVTNYVKEFTNLKDITIFDLLTFTYLVTDKRIDKAKTKEEAESILFTTHPLSLPKGVSSYNDFSAMVLKYVIEQVTGLSYYDFLKENILEPLKMNDTLVKIDKDKINRVASHNADVRYYRDGHIEERNYIKKGLSSDDKARILGQEDGNLSGHAGLFSTSSDMSKFAWALINNNLINENTMQKMVKNRTGYLYQKADGTISATQYLGMLCYVKNPLLPLSEVYHPLSGQSFSIAGWTGTYLSIDPLNEISLFLGSNRTHNRLSINEMSTLDNTLVTLPNGRVVIDSSQYATKRDKAIIHPALTLTFKLKILEDLLEVKEITKEKKLTLVK